LSAFGIATMFGSNPVPPSPPVDADGDGWFTAATNAAMVVTLTSAAFPGGPVPGGFEILVDEVRFPLSPTLNGRFGQPFNAIPGTVGGPTPIGTPVATRVRGVSGAGTTGTPFAITVSTRYHPFVPPALPAPPPIVAADVRVRFGETTGPLPPIIVALPAVGMITLNFAVTTTAFADPNPMNGKGDSDADGLPEDAEASLSTAFRGIFDPRPGSAGDIHMIVGRTDPAYTLLGQTREDMRSRFIQHSINMHLDEGTLNGMAGNGGLMNLTGTGVPAAPADVITPAQLTAVRNVNIPLARRATSQFLLIATAVTLPTGTTFGFSIPGSTTYGAGLPILGGTSQFQKGMVMHELGHAIGLCHPVSQDGMTTGGPTGTSCGTCGSVPLSERVGSASVMGAPADDPNPLARAWNAVTRPDDYSLSQWPLIRLGCSLTP
jgi:hypothetical protein